MTPLDTNGKWVAALLGHGALLALGWALALGALGGALVACVLMAFATVAYAGLCASWRVWRAGR